MSWSGREALPDVREAFSDVWECSEGPPGCPGVVRRPCRMSGSCVRPSPKSRRPCECLGVVGRLFWMSGWPSQMSGSVRKALPDVREALSDVREALLDIREWSGGSLVCPGVVERPSQMSKSGRETLQDVRKWSRDPPRCSGVVRGPPECPGGLVDVCSGQDALADVWEWSGYPPGCPGGPLGCPGVVGRPSRMSGSVWEAFPDVREWSAGPHG